MTKRESISKLPMSYKLLDPKLPSLGGSKPKVDFSVLGSANSGDPSQGVPCQGVPSLAVPSRRV